MLIEKFKSNKYFGHFSIYSLTSFCTGMICGGLGPIIPFLSKQYGIDQINYSFLFLIRGSCFLIVTLFMGSLVSYFKIHNVLILGTFLCSFFYGIFSFFQNPIIQGICMFFGSLGLALCIILTFVSFTMTHPGSIQQFWLQLKQASFGIGSLISPILISYMQLDGYVIIGILSFLTMFLYFKYDTPQIVHKAIQKEQIANQNPIVAQIAPQSVEKYYFLTLFMIIGLQICIAGWMPSYAVSKQVDNANSAPKYVTIYWVSMTVSRFLLIFIPGKVYNKIKYTLLTSIVVCFISCILIKLSYIKFALYISSIILGFLLAPNFPWLMTISIQYGFKLSQRQVNLIFIGGSLGQGIVTSIFGLVMSFIGIDTFYYLLTISCIIIYFTFYKIVQGFNNQKKQKNGIQLQQKLTNF